MKQILLVFLSIYGLKAQNNDQNWKELKSKLKESKAPNWNYCFIDGKPNFSYFTDPNAPVVPRLLTCH